MAREKDTDVYIRPIPKEDTKLLMARGVPYQDIPLKVGKTSVGNSLVRISYDHPQMPTRVISSARQLKGLAALMQNPFRGNYVVGISSFPSDLRAKHLAVTIMHHAIQHQRSMRTGKALPHWHRVFGGFNDTLRDKMQVEVPSMLIISNVNDQSSSFKLEKVRDLLEKFSNIPRIVVMGGQDPCSLFTQKLYYPIKLGLYLGPDNRIREV